jgi:phosphate transport system substrate-binding protein
MISKISARLLAVLILAIFQHSCRNRQGNDSSGISLRISSDESFQQLTELHMKAFRFIYNVNEISCTTVNEDQAVMDLLNGRSKIAVISRTLNRKEREFMRWKKSSLGELHIATDALVFVTNRKCGISELTTDQLKGIFSGRIYLWNQINESLPADSITIIADKEGYSDFHFLKSNLTFNKPVRLFAAASDSTVAAYVVNNKNVIGVTGMNFFNDGNEADSLSEGVRIVSVADSEKNQNEYFQPTQDNVGEGKYPLIRKVYIVFKNNSEGAPAAFSSFVLSEPGQRIIWKSGLVPAVKPGRVIAIKQ